MKFKLKQSLAFKFLSIATMLIVIWIGYRIREGEDAISRQSAFGCLIQHRLSLLVTGLESGRQVFFTGLHC